MDVNVNGVLFTAQAAGRQMARFGNGGSIVLIASMSGTITNKVRVSPVMYFAICVFRIPRPSSPCLPAPSLLWSLSPWSFQKFSITRSTLLSSFSIAHSYPSRPHSLSARTRSRVCAAHRTRVRPATPCFPYSECTTIYFMRGGAKTPCSRRYLKEIRDPGVARCEMGRWEAQDGKIRDGRRKETAAHPDTGPAGLPRVFSLQASVFCSRTKECRDRCNLWRRRLARLRWRQWSHSTCVTPPASYGIPPVALACISRSPVSSYVSIHGTVSPGDWVVGVDSAQQPRVFQSCLGVLKSAVAAQFHLYLPPTIQRQRPTFDFSNILTFQHFHLAHSIAPSFPFPSRL